VSAVCEIGFCGSSLWEWVLWQQVLRTGFVAVVCENGFWGSILWNRVLWHQFLRMGFGVSDCEKGFCGSRFWEWILWHQTVVVNCVVAESEKTCSTFCSLEYGDADLSVYCDTSLEIYRILRVTIHMLRGFFHYIEDLIEGSILLEFLYVSKLQISLYN